VAKLIEESTGYPALSVLNDDSTDGVLAGDRTRTTLRRPLDPMAFPGIRGVDHVGLGELSGRTSALEVDHVGATSPATLDRVGAGREVASIAADAYSLRLHASRRLYDRGMAMLGSPALSELTATTRLHVHHADLDRLGVDTGDRVRVTGSGVSVEMSVVADDDVPRGVAEVPVNTVDDDGQNVLARLVTRPELVSLVRLETR